MGLFLFMTTVYIFYETYQEIILAANYLDIPKLLDYTCIVVAQQIRGKSPDEIRKVRFVLFSREIFIAKISKNVILYYDSALF